VALVPLASSPTHSRLWRLPFLQASDFGVYWIEPANGATVTAPFNIKRGVKGLDLAPA
jgi:hypothetical protein